MINIKSLKITVFFITSLLFQAYSLPLFSAEQQEYKEIKINLINFSEEDFLELFMPLLPSKGYVFHRDYSYADNIYKPVKGAIDFFESMNKIEGKNFYRLSSNTLNRNGAGIKIDWDISDGFFLENRKKEALKFTTETLFDSQESDVHAVFTKKLLESDSITDLKPLYSEGDVVKEINGYEFNYHIQRSSSYRAARTASEMLAVCALGVGNYYLSKYENMVDWQYTYTWHDAKQKVKDGWYWDPNNFNTNTLYHLYAGMTYYQIARSNYYNIPQSLAWTFTGSLIWEFFGEWREQVSLNDMIFTPMLGAITGEALIQTDNYIEKTMRPGILRETISLIINPAGWLNKMLDSSNSGDMRVRLVFTNPIQAAIENKVGKEFLNR